MLDEFCTLGRALSIIQKAFDSMNARRVGHGERVAYIVWKLLGENDKYDEDTIIKLIIVSFFHDIGAYKIHENIDSELDSPHKHSIYGYLFLKYLSPCTEQADVVLYHHVKYKDFQYVISDNEEEAMLLNFADRLDMLIRSDVSINYENITYLTEDITTHSKVRTFMNVNEREKLAEKIKDGSYRDEFMNFLDSYIFATKDLIEFVKMLVFVIDFRSHHTLNHSVYVWIITELLCDIVTVDDDKREDVILAAFLHDIGKLATPVEILEKRGRLTKDEMNIMRQHVVESKNIVQGLGLVSVANILSLHHEKLDGSGYPNGVIGSDIPFESKIIMVVDIFSALVGVRSYKEAYPKAVVVNILNELVSNGKIDKDIVFAIIDNYDYLLEESNNLAAEYTKIYELINEEFDKMINEKVFQV